MDKKERNRKILRVLIACNLLFIWGNSLLPGEVSQAISDGVKAVLAFFFSGDGSPDTEGGFWIRKLAHFSEFACLGVLLTLQGHWKLRKRSHSFAFGVAAACVDELIQCFVPERGPALRDVCIDSAGVAVGLLLCGYCIDKRKK